MMCLEECRRRPCLKSRPGTTYNSTLIPYMYLDRTDHDKETKDEEY